MEPESELKHLAPEPTLLATLLYVHGGSGHGESAHTDAHHMASGPQALAPRILVSLTLQPRWSSMEHSEGRQLDCQGRGRVHGK